MQLVKKNKKLLVICPHQVGVAPGQRLKYEQYFNSWTEANWDITVEPFNSARFQTIIYKKGHFLEKVFWVFSGYFKRVLSLLKLKDYDAVYIFLWVTPFGLPFFEKLFVARANKVIYDIDDAIFLHNKSEYNTFISFLKGRGKPVFLMKHAHHVVTCTPYLDNFVRQYNLNTTDISSTINSDTYVPVNPYKNDHKLVLGWSGSHSTVKYLNLLQNVLLEIQKKYAFKLLVMGDAHFKMEGLLDVESIAWSETKEISVLQRIDIGLYPLPNEEWVYGKSGLKAIQYMALGIPTVATAIGTNFRVIEDNISGFLVNNESEWVERLSELIENPNLRKRIGQAAREKIEKEFSIKANASKYLSIFENLLNNSHGNNNS